MCVDAINKFPNTYGADQCRVLENQISLKQLNVQVEKINSPDIRPVALTNVQSAGKEVLAVGVSLTSGRHEYDAAVRVIHGIEIMISPVCQLPQPGAVDIDFPQVEGLIYTRFTGENKPAPVIGWAQIQNESLACVEYRTNPGVGI